MYIITCILLFFYNDTPTHTCIDACTLNFIILYSVTLHYQNNENKVIIKIKIKRKKKRNYQVQKPA